MPRLYLPSTVTPLVTPRPQPGWEFVGAASGQNGVAQPSTTDVGDLILWWGRGDTIDPSGPDLDGSWEQVVRYLTPWSTWVGAFARLSAVDGSTTYTSPADGANTGVVGCWRPEEAVTTLAVAESQVSDTATTPTVAAVPGGIHVGGFLSRSSDSQASTWATEPPTYSGHNFVSGGSGVSLLGFALAESGNVGGWQPATSSGHTTETTFMAALGDSG